MLGVIVPLVLAAVIQRQWMWFIANFCVLANGAYLATAWFSGDRYLDTPKLLEHGASPITILLYCILTIGYGYIAFRKSCFEAFRHPASQQSPVELTSQKQQSIV